MATEDVWLSLPFWCFDSHIDLLDRWCGWKSACVNDAYLALDLHVGFAFGEPGCKFSPRELKAGVYRTFPHNGDLPTKVGQCRAGGEVALPVAGKLSVPEYRPGLRELEVRATFVPVPEASMYKYHRVPFGEDKVGFAWQTWSMQAVSETRMPKILPDL